MNMYDITDHELSHFPRSKTNLNTSRKIQTRYEQIKRELKKIGIPCNTSYAWKNYFRKNLRVKLHNSSSLYITIKGFGLIRVSNHKVSKKAKPYPKMNINIHHYSLDEVINKINSIWKTTKTERVKKRKISFSFFEDNYNLVKCHKNKKCVMIFETHLVNKQYTFYFTDRGNHELYNEKPWFLARGGYLNSPIRITRLRVKKIKRGGKIVYDEWVGKKLTCDYYRKKFEKKNLR